MTMLIYPGDGVGKNTGPYDRRDGRRVRGRARFIDAARAGKVWVKREASTNGSAIPRAACR